MVSIPDCRMARADSTCCPMRRSGFLPEISERNSIASALGLNCTASPMNKTVGIDECDFIYRTLWSIDSFICDPPIKIKSGFAFSVSLTNAVSRLPLHFSGSISTANNFSPLLWALWMIFSILCGICFCFFDMRLKRYIYVINRG